MGPPSAVEGGFYVAFGRRPRLAVRQKPRRIGQTRRQAASDWKKGRVENQVGLVHERFFTPRLRFNNYDERALLNARRRLVGRCSILWLTAAGPACFRPGWRLHRAGSGYRAEGSRTARKGSGR
ncbi:hypothetical protein DB459_12655 [Bradyrhizobium sp. WD16]|nr:hypothetical protein DB459_12655 [Bradyrhizobium sp. WD16]